MIYKIKPKGALLGIPLSTQILVSPLPNCLVIPEDSSVYPFKLSQKGFENKTTLHQSQVKECSKE